MYSPAGQRAVDLAHPPSR